MNLNIDDLLSQNKFLNESNRNLRQELVNLKKSNNESMVTDRKFIEHLIKKADTHLKECNIGQQSTQAFQIIEELKELTENLFENLNDKLTANVHQRKVR